MKATDFISLHKNHFDFKKFVQAAIKEDVGDGDHTSLSTLDKTKKGKMRLIVKEKGILAGVEVAEKIFQLLDKKIKFKKILKDGSPVKFGDIAFTVEGNMQKLLVGERLVLNIMQRMSGIATNTTRLLQICYGTKAKIIDTRKTTPGFRFFEKWAVLIGGGSNHRYGLFDMILIKDNHIDFAGGITKAVSKSAEYLKKKKKKLKIECEARSINDVNEILKVGGVDRILLDNFSPAQTKHAIEVINGKIETESSGGINEKNIRLFAETGVDFISVGALTHHVNALDMSLKVFK
ncbi:MAG: carboxylating nicotinate-nucleotide diphosphorylase [Bacteroidia bacterium]|nr:carboxylating nicotinate-nucleotide diphosphorylase [Bacteroidia bacterium]